VVANSVVLPLVGDRAVGALDDPALAPFFAADAELPAEWRSRFKWCDLVLSYLHDPARIFEQNVLRCGARRFVVGPSKLCGTNHATEQLAVPLRDLGIHPDDLTPRLHIDQNERQKLGEQLSLPREFIALHPGSGSPSKNWPITHWIELTHDLLRSRRAVAVIIGEAERTQLELFRVTFGERVAYAIDWPLRDLAALLASSTFIGHDSGISHLAAAAGANCTVLFGATDPNVWSPRGDRVRVLRSPDGDLARLDVAAVGDAVDQELMRIGIST
jgi:heptosyltransferase-2